MKKILISLMIFVAIIFVVNAVNAENLKWADFKNNRLYCIEMGQTFQNGNYTKNKLTYDTSSASTAYKSGLGYILSYEWSGTRKSYTFNSSSGTITYYDTANDPVQLALWKYFSETPNETKKFFNGDSLNNSILSSSGHSRLIITERKMEK